MVCARDGEQFFIVSAQPAVCRFTEIAGMCLLAVYQEYCGADLAEMNRTLDMIRFKCWYYEQAMKDGNEDRLKVLIPDQLSDEIREAYENAHKK